MAWLSSAQVWRTVHTLIGIAMLVVIQPSDLAATATDQWWVNHWITQSRSHTSPHTLQSAATIASPFWQPCDDPAADLVPPIIVGPAGPLIADLTDCTPTTATFLFSATAWDACSGARAVTVIAPPQVQVFVLPDQWLVVAPVGLHQLSLSATDAAGNTRTQPVLLLVNQLIRPATRNLACLDTINVVYTADCATTITPSMVLATDRRCLDEADYRIHITDEDPTNGNLLDGVGVFPYTIESVGSDTLVGWESAAWTSMGRTERLADTLWLRDTALLEWTSDEAGVLSLEAVVSPDLVATLVQIDSRGAVSQLAITATTTLTIPTSPGARSLIVVQGGQLQLYAARWISDPAPPDPICWGYVQVFASGLPATIDCPAATDQITLPRYQQQYTDTMTVVGPFVEPSKWSCYRTAITPQPLVQPFRAYSFRVDRADQYTFHLRTSWGRGVAALYLGEFDPAYPCDQVLALANPFERATGTVESDPLLRLSTRLQPGQTYTLVVLPDELVEGNLTWTVYADAGGRIVNLPTTIENVSLALIGNDLDRLVLSSDTTYCYDLNAAGAIVLPTGPSERQRVLRLLRRLATTGLIGDTSTVAAFDCTAIEVCVTDAYTPQLDCARGMLARTFTLTDPRGERISCTQSIRARLPRLSDIILPPAAPLLDCDTDFATYANGLPTARTTGYPQLETAFGRVDLAPGYLTLNTTLEDKSYVDYCPGSYEYVRKWTLLDWCNPGATRFFHQIIRVGDFTPPTIGPVVGTEGYTWQGDTLVIATGGSSCEAVFTLPVPGTTDGCDTARLAADLFRVQGQDTVFQAVQFTEHGTLVVLGAANGYWQFRYRALDGCNNQTTTEPLIVEIRDGVAPVAVCKDDLHFSLSNDGRLFAAQVDHGSYDNCQLAKLEVRRLDLPAEPCTGDTSWGEFVTLFCCDVGEYVPVALRVTDAAGNVNSCWTEVLVEDKLAPTCYAPPARTLTCTQLPGGFTGEDTLLMQQWFGYADAGDGCSAVIRELNPVIDWPDCGGGTITRRFQAEDRAGNKSLVCTQRISIQPSHHYAIRFPADTAVYCAEPIADTLYTYDYGCDLLTVYVEDERLVAVDDACFKLRRTYEVINWCEYDGYSDPVTIGRDEDCDLRPGDEAVWLIRRPTTAYTDRDSVPENDRPQRNINSCNNPLGYWNEVPTGGYYRYTQLLKVYDNVPPEVLISQPFPFCATDNETCSALVQLRFLVNETCSVDGLTFEATIDVFNDGVLEPVPDNPFQGLYPKFLFEYELPIGEHEVCIFVTDGCGNTTRECVLVTVADCKVETPVCIHGLAGPLEREQPNTDADGDGIIDTASLTIRATDFIASEIRDCSGPVTYSINRVGELPDSSQQTITFTCDDVGYQAVEVYVWDRGFNPYLEAPDGSVGSPNYAWCVTYFLVQDDNNFNWCPGINGRFPIAGQVRTLTHEPVPDASISLTGPMDTLTLSNTTGNYRFDSIYQGADLYLAAAKPSDWARGVTTLDLILISRHILGVVAFTSPYQYLAADVNESGTITTLDIVLLRRLILGINDRLPGPSAYRFLPVGTVISDTIPVLEQNLPTHQRLPSAMPDLPSVDFLAIKLGDVSGAAHDVQQDRVKNRSADQLLAATWTVANPDQHEYWIELTLADAGQEWSGYQFALDLGGLPLTDVSVEPGSLSDQYFRITPEAQIIVAVDSAATSGETLLKIIVRTTQPLDETTDYLQLSSDFDHAAYTRSLATHPLVLQEYRLANEARPAALQTTVSPNPFSDHLTVAGFTADSNQPITIVVHDLLGREIWRQSIQVAGMSHWQHQLDLSTVPLYQAAYVLSIQQSGGEVVQHKLIRVQTAQ